MFKCNLPPALLVLCRMTGIFYMLLEYHRGGTDPETTVITESWPWRSKFSHHSSNLWPFDHESGTLTAKLSPLPRWKQQQILWLIWSQLQEHKFERKKRCASAGKCQTWSWIFHSFNNMNQRPLPQVGPLASSEAILRAVLLQILQYKISSTFKNIQDPSFAISKDLITFTSLSKKK